MTSKEYIHLYQKYISGNCTPEEEKRLFEYKDGFKFQDTDAVDTEIKEDKVLRRQIYNRIKHTIETKKTPVFSLWFKYAATVLLILSAATAVYLVNSSQREELVTKEIASIAKQAPVIDSSAVVLTLSDGSMISLNEANDGLLTEEGSSKINKTGDGEIIYQNSDNLIQMYVSLNKLSVPKGSQYKLTLADGTIVWLNANSTLHYPSAFRGVERLVELSGEAYFEVAKNDKMPFIVKTKATKVQVLGTHFNVSAYTDDDFEKTTLAEGSVKLNKGNRDVILKPGQQGITTIQGEDIAVKKVNLQQVLAWKEGYFLFKEDNIRDVMKQISRWYNVDVEYEANVEEKLLGGIYSKSKNLEELLKGLELTGMVKFKVEGRRVIVMN